MINLPYSGFIAIVKTSGAGIWYVDEPTRYRLYLAHGPLIFSCRLHKLHDSGDVTDFEATYKSTSNNSGKLVSPTGKLLVEQNEKSPGDLQYKNVPFPLLTLTGTNEGNSEISFPYDFYSLNIEYSITGSVDGDTMDAEIDIDRDLTTIAPAVGGNGTLQQNAAAGQDRVFVDPKILVSGFIQKSYWIRFGGIGNPEYEVTKTVNKITGELRLDRNLENARTAGDTIYRTIVFGRGLHVHPGVAMHKYGSDKAGASKLAEGWKFRVTYHAIDTNGRTVRISTEGGVEPE